jgi:hypothetical protein
MADLMPKDPAAGRAAAPAAPAVVITAPPVEVRHAVPDLEHAALQAERQAAIEAAERERVRSLVAAEERANAVALTADDVLGAASPVVLGSVMGPGFVPAAQRAAHAPTDDEEVRAKVPNGAG